jgi:hypothetical protein
LLACTSVALAAAGVEAHSLSGARSCPIFPTDNPWNQRVDRLPVASDSAHLIAGIGLNVPVHPDFGTIYQGAPNGIPVTIVGKHTRRVPVSFTYSDESDHGRYPLPRNVAIEGGPQATGDRHVIVVDHDACVDYELWNAYPIGSGRRWQAGSGAIFRLRSDHLRPAGWTSADAAGLAILPGLARYDEVRRGAIDHALRFTSACSAKAYVYPARHYAPSGRCPQPPPQGLRVRLKASVDISGLPYQARVIARALKTYGMLLADNGSSWFISGEPDRRWSDDQLHQLDRLRGADLEVVDTHSLPHPGL